MTLGSNLAPSLADNVQANLVRTSKFADGRTRDWSLFLFFRIMTATEIQETVRRLLALAGSAEARPDTGAPSTSVQGAEAPSALRSLKLDLAQPALAQAGVASEAPPAAGGSHASSAPTQFLHWLRIIVHRDAAPLLKDIVETGQALVPPALRPPRASFGVRSRDQITTFFSTAAELQDDRTGFEALLADAWADLRRVATEPARELVLPIVLLYEFLRQAAPAFSAPPTHGAEASGRFKATVRDEATTDHNAAVPINIAFTHSGLAALGLDKQTLASFPDAFRQGMAARAQRLGDQGRNAPENWEGELGQASIHGYFSGGFDARPLHPTAAFWRKLRAEIRAFNDATDKNVRAGPDLVGLREQVQTLFRIVGMELLHIELGQDPDQEAADASSAAPRHKAAETAGPARREHFGFRDGLSQPFVDLKLGDTAPGGGTPARRGGWTPVAPGEIFLCAGDEDGEVQATPVNRLLRQGSTYLVFRKLEQDVTGLRSFLARQHPHDTRARNLLAAQFVGRWPSGAPLVLSPYEDTPATGPGEAPLNDFRYAADDPKGRLCPLGAHVRRANPRDIGGRNEVRHHRILRRGISYGGPLLPEDSLGDGEPRGMLFIAANARIDLQFEVIQAEWLNGGEFLGQAGLGRCPLTGGHAGATGDRFLARDAMAPITGLPSFVTLRGGDYFFAPGLPALRRIADGDYAFPPSETPYNGFSMGDVRTPTLFDEERVTRLAGRLLDPRETRRAIVVAPSGDASARMAFVGRHADVCEVLANTKAADAASVAFSVSPYLETGRDITRGHDLLIGTEDGSPNAETRRLLQYALNGAWKILGDWLALRAGENPAETPHADSRHQVEAIRRIVDDRLNMALRTAAGARRLDLIEDFAAQAAYGVTSELLGLPGPNWVTEMAPALAYAKQHVGALPADWLSALQGQAPTDPGFTTMRLWNSVLVADLIGNIERNTELKMVSRQAGAELLNHIDLSYLTMGGRARNDPEGFAKGAHPNLLAAFLALENQPETEKEYTRTPHPVPWRDRYRQDVSMILLEIAGSTLAVIPLTFSHVIEQLFRMRIDLSHLLGEMSGGETLKRIVYEAERLNPNLAVRLRLCQQDKTFEGGGQIKAGDAVAALIAAANMDGRVFSEPGRFHVGQTTGCPMGGKAGGPSRPLDQYLMFGVRPLRDDAGQVVRESHKYCWGADRVAMPVLEACVAQAGRLQGLRRIAGPRGEPQKLAGVTIGLQARFSRVLPERPRRPEPPPCAPSATSETPPPAMQDPASATPDPAPAK